MRYKFAPDLENDEAAYEIMFNVLDSELDRKEIPTKAGRKLRTPNGLIAIIPFPQKSNARACRELEKIPGFVRITLSKDRSNGRTITLVSAVYNGIMLMEGLGNIVERAERGKM